MKKKTLFALLLAAVMLLSGCSLVLKDSAVDAKQTIIDVNGEQVDKQTFLNAYNYTLTMQQYYAQMLQQFGGDGTVDEASILQSTLDNYISSLVLSQKAKELGFDQFTDAELAELQAQAQEEYDTQLESIRTTYFADSELEGDALTAEVTAYAKANGYTLDYQLDTAKSNKISERLKASVTDTVTITDDDRQAAQRLSELGRFSAIDINMGCPARKVTGSGSGSALMRDLPLCAQIITAVRKSTVLPVTVKRRLGWDDDHLCAPELAHIAQECGADLLTVHGRTREQQYAGQADWQAVARVKQAVRIPVLLNGDSISADSALRALRETGCDGLAIGRGALGNPFLFAQIRAALAGQPVVYPTFEQVVETAIRHGEMMRAWKQEHAAVTEMRKHMCWYIHGRRGAARLRTQLTALDNLDDVYALLRQFAREQSAQSTENCITG